MAGSYAHAIDRQGRLRDNNSFAGMIENGGDAYEMAEEMYGMIWWLAVGDSEVVAEAAARWREGIGSAPGQQRPQF